MPRARKVLTQFVFRDSCGERRISSSPRTIISSCPAHFTVHLYSSFPVHCLNDAYSFSSLTSGRDQLSTQTHVYINTQMHTNTTTCRSVMIFFFYLILAAGCSIPMEPSWYVLISTHKVTGNKQSCQPHFCNFFCSFETHRSNIFLRRRSFDLRNGTFIKEEREAG